MSTDNKVKNNQEQPDVTDSEQQSPGAILQKAREAAKLSVREVADQLHLVSSQVKALEENRFDYFHGEVFCKGYLRSYAKLLELDVEHLMDCYSRLCPEQLAVNVEKNNGKMRHVQNPGKGRSIQYWCIAIVVVVAALLWALSGDGNEARSPSLLDDDSLLAVDESDRSLLKSLENGGSQTPDAQKRTGEADVTAQLMQLVDGSESTDVNGGRSVGVEQVSSAAISQPSVVTGDDILSFRFTDDCWVEVTDGDDNLLIADLKRAAEVLKLRGRAPFKVVLGYAPAVSLEYNGKPITIKSNRTGNTAKITVGKS